MTHLSMGLLFALLWLLLWSTTVPALAKEMECRADGSCVETTATKSSDGCGLWLAESSIPNAGWGMYTGKNLPAKHVMDVTDVSIQLVDYVEMNKRLHTIYNKSQPGFLFKEYYWDSDSTWSTLDAMRIDSCMSGFGMLINSHAGLNNLDNIGCFNMTSGPRSSPRAGAVTHYQDCQFHTLQEIPAGHELFADYGDSWFLTRSKTFGDDLPLSDDFKRADRIKALWQHAVKGLDAGPEFAAQLWDLVVGVAQPHLSKRSRRALPKNTDAASKVGTVAYETVPNVIRSTEWLQANGLCLDHIQVEPIERHERGLVARHPIKKGMIVAPAPVLHLSRNVLDMLLVDNAGGFDTVMWQGRQLLLNYCYGHEKSSILLFPYAPGISLINHSREPNIELRWSKRMFHTDWLNLSAAELLEHNAHAGLMMEFYALKDIDQGESILYDYGDAWQKAWDEHGKSWTMDVVHAEDYISAWDYGQQCDVTNAAGNFDCMNNVPSWIETRCFVENVDAMEEQDVDGWYGWVPLPSTEEPHGYFGELTNSKSCRVEIASGDGTFKVTVLGLSKILRSTKTVTLKVKNVPRSAIVYTDLAYTNNQFLRRAFRHEIGLPDEMIPATWKDLEPKASNCGLYMAESAIPNSGLGMYSAEAIPRGERIFYGDVVVQAEDIEENMKLRRWHGENKDKKEKTWLLHNYYWNPDVTFALNDAVDIQSIIPGIGMLANSHTGLVNARERAPSRVAHLHRGRDPGTGASTTYHDVHFVASQDIEAGAELFVQYGDSWFEDRADHLGIIPLSGDFKRADEIVAELAQIVANNTKGDNDSNADLVMDALRVKMTEASNVSERLVAALPKDYEAFEKAVKKGTASLTVPSRIRSLKWLEENGRCLDNIKPGLSTIRQAGRGAFATRDIRKGDVIAPMPVVHLRRHHMEVYGADDYNDPNTDTWFEGQQLLLNYCYGHPNSTLLLFPYSPVVNYVNHNYTGYNADLRWSNLTNHHTEWLKQKPNDLDKEDHSGLIMEMVATRDVHAGEEIFLNYGPSWEASWNLFVEKWVSRDEDRTYASAAMLNQRIEWLKTEAELETDPYLFEGDVFTICFMQDFDKTIEDLDDDEDDDKEIFEWSGSADLFESSDYAYPCTVLERETIAVDLQYVMDRKDSVRLMDGTRYTVRLSREGDDSVYVTKVPRKAIRFVDSEYQSDDFLRNAFRHEIHIPDAMFPAAWRDLTWQDVHKKASF